MSTPTLTPLQERAVKASRAWFSDAAGSGGDFVLTGYAGTGKSTILPSIIDSCGIHPDQVGFCAPTGKAAKVMTTKLGAFGINQRARTIHSFIYRPRAMRAEMLEKQLDDYKAALSNALETHRDNPEVEKVERVIELRKSIKLLERDLDKAYEETEGPKFQFNPDSELRNKRLIVVDEGSMVGDSVADDLRYFGIPILVMGDPGQLPPVGEPAGFLNRDPDFFLDEVHRQAEGSPIIRIATMARQGKEIPLGMFQGESDDEWVNIVDRRGDTATYDMDRSAQILVGTNKKRWLVTNKLRKLMGITTSGPVAGEPLIVCKNSRNNPDLVNGTFVKCAEDVGDLRKGEDTVNIAIIDEQGVRRTIPCFQGILEEHRLQIKGASTADKKRAFRARITGEHIDFGMAITCHKSQGSQWDEVIVHDESGVFGEDSEKWLYTAITRAAKRLTVVV